MEQDQSARSADLIRIGMSRFIAPLKLGQEYDRKTLAELWGLKSFHALGKGVFTPKGGKEIILFVTRERLGWMTKYENLLVGPDLLWEGEQGHGSDERIVNASRRGDEIHLFYRDTRASPFAYHGRIILFSHNRYSDRPSKFVFRLVEASVVEPDIVPPQVQEEQADYAVISEAGLNSIDQRIMTKSRGVAQRLFRGNLLRLWQGSCAVTGVEEPAVLRSSHIKPWATCTNKEKVDHYNGLMLTPDLDALFNEGLISFRDTGQILISSSWRPSDQVKMHISPELRLRTTHRESNGYLEFHRDVRFKVS